MKNNVADIFKKYRQKLLAFIRDKVQKEEDAEDILQDVFLRLIQTEENTSILQISGWLYQVARNSIIDRNRKQQEERMPQIAVQRNADSFLREVTEILVDEDLSPDKEYLRTLVWEELEKALSELLLQTRNLTKQYGRHRAVDDVNMHIKKGAIYGFIGRNGAGKTTCLKMISGLSTPSYGEIEMFGYKGKDLQKVRSRVGCLIEAPGLYGNMSAYDNLNIKCKLTGIKKKGYIEELLKTVGLDTVGEKKTKHYSLGMKQRLGIALALVGEPDLLILDEPINGLDPQGIVEVRETIQKLAKERGMTICISSHILEELSKIATDYGIIHNGCLVQELTREELMKKCSERIELTLDNPKQAIPVLDDMGFSSYQVIDKEHIHIFERLGESARLNMELAKAGILVKGISITSEELENYFLRLTGGDNRA